MSQDYETYEVFPLALVSVGVSAQMIVSYLSRLTCKPTIVTSKCLAKKSDRSQLSTPVKMNAILQTKMRTTM